MRLSPSMQHCRNVKADGDTCDEEFGAFGDHGAICPCGPLRIRRHDAIADELADCIAETGAHVRREAWIREFVTPEADAVLDIWAFGGQGIQDLLVDVTICHPMAAKYQP